MRIRSAAFATLVTSLALLIAPTPANAAKPAVQLQREPTATEIKSGRVECHLQVTGQAADGQLLTAPDSGDVMASFVYVGEHYDGFGLTGSRLLVYGSACSGGYLNVPASWVNKISSTYSPCYALHFDLNNLTGISEGVSWGDLTYMNNKTNSIQYL
jgi:hypothetical protein